MWKSHADPEIRRVSKPGPESVYPAYVVSESDKGSGDHFFRRLLGSAAVETVLQLS